MRPFQRGFTIRTNHVSRGNPTSSKQVLYILVSGKVDSETDLENKLGQTARSMPVNGEKIGHMEREDSSMLMEIFMTVIGLMTKLMAVESINT